MNAVDLVAYRQSPREQARIDSLLSLLPLDLCRSVLDIGARDGHITQLLAERFPEVTALDLEEPRIDNPAIRKVKGDATNLQFREGDFDLIVCSEVLEHIPSPGLEAACREIVRVAKRRILIGVPFRQDLRLGKTTCNACGAHNPPWGHVNSFDQARLEQLFRPARLHRVELVGQGQGRTNRLSSALMDWAGNPWGNYHQQEPCLQCGASTARPQNDRGSRGLLGKVACHLAYRITALQNSLSTPGAMWIHCVFEKQ